ncbi:MAG: TrkA family potassium uptake protein [Actinomycetaceae bacterium]|nr:TrkA family potassium uptake protein [Actinomycetaceae bacterium]
MRIVIAGAGAVGRSIARELLSHGHDVTLMDSQADKMQVASVADADWILADACSPDALAQADVDVCDVMVAATGDDKANLVISLLAKTEFAVPRTVARVNNPKNEWMFNDQWGVDVSVSTPRVITALVEDAVAIGTPVHLFTFPKSGASMYSITISGQSDVLGRRLADLEIPHSAVVAALIRDTRPLAPLPELSLEEDDKLLFLFRSTGEDDLKEVTGLFSNDAELPYDPAQED